MLEGACLPFFMHKIAQRDLSIAFPSIVYFVNRKPNCREKYVSMGEPNSFITH